ncbi:hypothetical protein HK405_003173 [Cladochytrium tenue]|nr:hypothetical protein HK405_003173 [Cladochytrium tenue]
MRSLVLISDERFDLYERREGRARGTSVRLSPDPDSGCLFACIDGCEDSVPVLVKIDPTKLDSDSTLFSVELPPSPPLSPDASAAAVSLASKTSVVNIQHLPDADCVCVAYVAGDILLYPASGDTPESVAGTVDSGILAMEWSPDRDIVVFVTGTMSILVMTKDFDLIAEVPGITQEFGADEFINVGWGRKETQFHGSAGKAAARAKAPEAAHTLSPDDDRLPRISWRGDGSFFAILEAQAEQYQADGRFSDAATLFYSAGLKRDALNMYRKDVKWVETLTIASELGLPSEEQMGLAEDLAAALVELGKYAEAATILQDYKNDTEEAIKALLRGSLWTEAMRISQRHSRPELLEEMIKPGVLEGLETILEELTELEESYKKHRSRLDSVRLKIAEKQADVSHLVSATFRLGYRDEARALQSAFAKLLRTIKEGLKGVFTAPNVSSSLTSTPGALTQVQQQQVGGEAQPTQELSIPTEPPAFSEIPFGLDILGSCT